MQIRLYRFTLIEEKADKRSYTKLLVLVQYQIMIAIMNAQHWDQCEIYFRDKMREVISFIGPTSVGARYKHSSFTELFFRSAL